MPKSSGMAQNHTDIRQWGTEQYRQPGDSLHQHPGPRSTLMAAHVLMTRTRSGITSKGQAGDHPEA